MREGKSFSSPTSSDESMLDRCCVPKSFSKGLIVVTGRGARKVKAELWPELRCLSSLVREREVGCMDD